MIKDTHTNIYVLKNIFYFINIKKKFWTKRINLTYINKYKIKDFYKSDN
jgi:hypothetical protein